LFAWLNYTCRPFIKSFSSVKKRQVRPEFIRACSHIFIMAYEVLLTQLLGEAEYVFRIVLAALLAALVGMEREKKELPAGMRTYMLVSIASALATVVSLEYFPNPDSAARIVTGLITGMGFLGAGTIILHRDHVFGLTTAAGLWSMCVLGFAVGLGMYLVSIVTTLLIYGILKMKTLERKYIDHKPVPPKQMKLV